MDLQALFTDWARKMGFTGTLPSDLDSLVNAETAHIWVQLIEKVKPKRHVENVRRNILLRRLKQEEGDQRPQSFHKHFDGPCEALEVWKRRRELEHRLAALKERVRENEVKLQKLSIETKTQNVILKKTRDNVKQHERLAVLYQAKAEQLEQEIVHVNEMIASASRLTPVEPSLADNKHEVQAALKKCAAKLERLIENEPRKKDSNFSLIEDTSFPELLDVDDDNVLGEVKNAPLAEHNINMSLQELLLKYDRTTLMRCLQDNYESSVLTLTCSKWPEESSETKDGFSKMTLYSEHIKCELEAKKATLEVENLKGQLEALVDSHVETVKEKSPHLDQALVKRALKLKLENVKLKAAENYMHRELEELKNSYASNSEDNFVFMQTKLKDVIKKESGCIEDIKAKINMIKQQHNDVGCVRAEMNNNLKKLAIQCKDIEWTTTLTAGLNEKELLIFRNCPQKQSIYASVDDTELYMLVNIVDAPYSPKETILENLFNQKRNLALLNSLHKQPITISCSKYAYNELVAKENNLENALETAKKLLHHIRNNKNLITNDGMLEIMRLWTEMPCRHYISPQRLVDGKDYKHYDKIYKNLLLILSHK